MSSPVTFVVLGAIALAAVGTAKLVSRLDAAHLAELKQSVAEANLAAAQKSLALTAAQEALSQQTGAAEGQAQAQIITRTNTIIQKVPQYVTVTQDRACVPYGLVRVLDAAALGLDPADLQPPAGQSDDACAPVTTSDLARSVAGNYGVARQNAEQLNGLEADVNVRSAILSPSAATTGAVQSGTPPLMGTPKGTAAPRQGLIGRLLHLKPKA